MCTTNEDVQCKQGCAVRIRQYESGSTNQAPHQYKRGCAVWARHIVSTNEDVLYTQDISSVQVSMCGTNQAHLQYKGGCVV